MIRIIHVKVKPESREEKIFMISPDRIEVSIREKAENNKANEAVLKLLAKQFNVEEKQIIIIKGRNQRNKTIKIYLTKNKEQNLNQDPL